jgi:hypothetical protein
LASTSCSRRGVGDDRDRLGHAAGDREPLAVALQGHLLVAGLREGALEARRETGLHEVVQQVLRLVLEAQDAHVGALLDVGQRHTLLTPPGVDRVAVGAGLGVADGLEHPFLHRG